MNDVSGIEDFFRRLAIAPAACLMLDYDGTLAPFHVNPARAQPYAGVRAVLDRMQSGGHTRVVIISGRWSRDLLPLLGLERRPEIWGSHGWERLCPDGSFESAHVAPDALRRLVEVDEWSDEIEALGGRCEFKPAGVAIHWRGNTPARISAIRDLVAARWATPALQSALEWHDFDGGIELRIPGRTKGFAVDAVLAGLAPGAASAYLGDDVTDEDAFRAIGGRGLGILVRNEPRQTAARHRLSPPDELLEFLHRWCVTREATT